ncbi:MAG: preprotein translocase subunit YajC [Pseudomonadota bacterium]
MFISQAHAQTAGAAGQPGGLDSILGIAPLFLVFIAFYFLMLRPQQKRMKALAASVDAVKKGDTVTTAGGIVGKVTKVDGAHVEVEIAPTVKVRVVKATLASVGAPAAPAND